MTNDELTKKWGTPTYIGDGLFIHFDGYHFILTTERENGIHEIGLEPIVFEAIIQYRDACYKQFESSRSRD